MENVGCRIRYARIHVWGDRGMTQAQLAKQLDCSRDTVRNWERGRVMPDVEKLKRVAAVCHADWRWLLLGDAITELLDRAVAAEAALEREKSYDTPLPPFDDDDPGVLYCQKCGSGEYLENEDGNRNEYCGQCGQRIDWAAYDAAIEALGGAGVG